MDLTQTGMALKDRRFEIVRKAALRAPAESTELVKFMGGSGFCQRGEFRCVEPAISVRSRDVDVCGGDDEQVQFWEVGKRVGFVTFADAEGTTAKKKERDIGSEAGGEVKEAG